MALWLELIPKIHRSDQLDRRFHLLDSYDNETTFERDGTRALVLDGPRQLVLDGTRPLVLEEPVVDDRYFITTTTSTSSAVSTTADSPMSSALSLIHI